MFRQECQPIFLIVKSLIINFSSYKTAPQFSSSKQHVRYSGQTQRVSQVKKIWRHKMAAINELHLSSLSTLGRSLHIDVSSKVNMLDFYSNAPSSVAINVH